MHRLIRSTLLAATLAALGPAQALAADTDGYPQGPISYVVPAPPGGLIDTMARTVAETMGRELKQPVVIENKPGGNTNIGIAYVARAKPDGLTWLAVSSTLAVNATLFKQLPFDPEKDLIPVALFATTPMGMAVPANSPYNNVQDIIKAAKVGESAQRRIQRFRHPAAPGPGAVPAPDRREVQPHSLQGRRAIAQ
ncbi:tripartite tricarboxylate transporter family receptor domain protein [Bordetella bronchiseptica 00-P-2730]|nr:tripartite tricarboxylate transporter family receptor domain protein [Bordetella bronchiseptica 00-P-2730]